MYTTDKNKPMKKGRGGDCYLSALKVAMDIVDTPSEPHASVVHGSVYSVPWKRYIRHAWVEIADIVIDNTISFAGRKERYYELGKPKVKQRYTIREALRLTVHTKHSGYWTKKEREECFGKKRREKMEEKKCEHKNTHYVEFFENDVQYGAVVCLDCKKEMEKTELNPQG